MDDEQGAFWDRVDKSGECWLWTSSKDKDGYGRFKYKRRYRRAHRASWSFVHGPITPSVYILHKCDVPACVRIDHLFAGDAKINALDAVSKGRNSRGERNGGARFNEADIAVIRSLHGKITQWEIANRFGVRQGVINGILLRRTWKHIT